jgi:hypothetical protein
MRETDNPQFVTVALELRRNDRYAVPRLGECQQGVRIPTLKRDRGFQSRHTTSCIESTTKSEAAVQQQQRKLGKVSQVDGTIRTKWHRGMAGCEQLYESKRKAGEVLLVKLDCVQQILTQMDFPPFKHCQYFAARTFANLHFNVRVPLRIPVQKLR